MLDPSTEREKHIRNKLFCRGQEPHTFRNAGFWTEDIPVLHAQFTGNDLFKIRHYLCLYVQSVFQKKSWPSKLCIRCSAAVAIRKTERSVNGVAALGGLPAGAVSPAPFLNELGHLLSLDELPEWHFGDPLRRLAQVCVSRSSLFLSPREGSLAHCVGRKESRNELSGRADWERLTGCSGSSATFLSRRRASLRLSSSYEMCITP